MPIFRVPLTNIMARVGQKIKLECEITGTPTPTIHWTHNGKVFGGRDMKVNLLRPFVHFYKLFYFFSALLQCVEKSYFSKHFPCRRLRLEVKSDKNIRKNCT